MQAASPRTWWPEFVLLAAVWGASFLFMRLSVTEFGPWAMAALRAGIASAVLLPMLREGHWHTFRQRWRTILVLGIFNPGIPFACYAFALLHIPTGISSILNATTPLFTACIAWAWLGARPDAPRLLGLLIGFAGVALLAAGRSQLGTNDSANTLLAMGACLMATFSYNIAACYGKKYLTGVHPAVLSAGSNFWGFVVLLPMGLLHLPPAMPGMVAWLSVLAVGVLCTAMAYVLFYRLIETAGPGPATSVTYLIPAFAVLYGTVFLNEPVTTAMLGAGAVIVVGTVLATGLLPRKKVVI